MTDITQSPLTDPTLIYRHRDALYASDMLIAALRGFDFFTWMEGAPRDIQAICQHFGFKPRPVDVMTTFFTASGWLRRLENGLFELTDEAREHLCASSPWYIGPYFPPLSDRPIAADLIEVLKSDRPAQFGGRKQETDWHNAMEKESFAKEFTAMMDCRGILLAQALAKNIDLSGRQMLLDIAGGSGIYACSLCAHFEGLHATVFEKVPVVEIAQNAIQKRGFEDRVTTVEGDMFMNAFPENHDVHLYSNVLHDWNEEDVDHLLALSAGRLPENGLLIIHDMFLDETKTGPLHTAEYSVLLMHVTQGRCYSTKEIVTMAERHDLLLTEHIGSAAGRSALIFSKTTSDIEGDSKS